MKLVTLAVLAMFALCAMSAKTYFPVPLRIGNRQYVPYGPRLLVFDLPAMTLVADKQYGVDISFPPVYTHSGNIIYIGDGASGHWEIDVNNGYSLNGFPSVPLVGGQGSEGYLRTPASTLCTSDSGVTYCFKGGNPATVTKTVSGSTTTISLLKDLDVSQFIKLDLTDGTLFVTGQKKTGTTTYGAMNYWIFTTSPFQIKNGPATLIHTQGNGCNVPVRQCTLESLLYMDAGKGVVSYIFGKAVPTNGDLALQVTLEAFSFPCFFSNATFSDLAVSTAPVIKSGPSCEIKPQPATCNPTGTCGVNDKCCVDTRTGKRCYSPVTHNCVLDEKQKTYLCGIFDGACNGVCYDARYYSCKPDGTLQYIH